MEDKKCSRCKERKPIEQFYVNKKLGLPESQCKACHALAAKRWREKSKAKIQAIGRLYNYQLTPEAFKALLKKQYNKCAICGVLFTLTIKPYIDHNHACCPGARSCGKCVRGLLCVGCNGALGNFGDSPRLLQRAIKYITGRC